MDTTYKQIRLTKIAETADEAVIDCLKVINIESKPIPAKDQLRLRVRLSSIHPCDLLCSAGLVAKSRTHSANENYKYLPGLDAVATIDAVGEELSQKFKVGKSVCVKAWSPWGKWQEGDGVWSEYLIVKKEKVILMPDEIDDPTAATFLSIAVTSYAMLVCELNLKPGDWLIQAAAGSAIGRWVIAFARTKGINVINLVRRQAQVEELKHDCGAEHVLCCASDGSNADALVDEIKQLTQGGNVKGALDPISDGIVASIMLRTMSRYGTIMKFGLLGNSPMLLSELALICMSQEALQIKGFSIQNWWLPDTSDEKKQAVFTDVLQLIKNNKEFNLSISAVYCFDEVGEAISASLKEKSAKIFITPRIENKSNY